MTTSDLPGRRSDIAQALTELRVDLAQALVQLVDEGKLTGEELLILHLAASDFSTAEIAQALHRSESWVVRERSRIFGVIKASGLLEGHEWPEGALQVSG